MPKEEKSESIIDQVKESVSSVTDKISDLKENLFDDEVVAEYKVMGTEATSKIISQLSQSKEVISRSGYEFKSISINIGIPPGVRVVFHYSKDIGENERQVLINESKDKKIIELLLKGLFKATDLYNSVKVGNFKLESVSIVIGLIPDITINLSAE